MAAINESLNQKMTALADEVRELSGVTEALSIDAMTTNISGANDEVNTQVDLISQLATALEGKAGNSGGNTFPYTITVTNNMNFEHRILYATETTEAIVMFPASLGGGENFIVTGCRLVDSMGVNNSAYCYYHLTDFTGDATVHVNFTNPYE